MQSKRILTILSVFLVALVGLMGAAFATDLTWDRATNGEWDNGDGNNWSPLSHPFV